MNDNKANREQASVMTKEQVPNQLQPSAQRFQDYLGRQGFNLTVVELSGSTRTALEASESVGCSVSQIAKSLVFMDKKNNVPVLLIVAGSNRVNLKKFEQNTGIRLARADGTTVKEQVGFSIGGVPPAGHSIPLQTFLDPDLIKHESIWAAGGTPRALFKLSPDDLSALTKGTWVELAQECP